MSGDGDSRRSPKSPKGSSRGSARRISFGGVISTLGIVLMYLGSIIDVLDMSAAAFAAILLIPIIAEYGRRDAILIYTVTALLSWLLLPNRSPALIYTVFLGYYPILKSSLHKRGRLWGTLFKLLILNTAITVAYFAAHLLLSGYADDSSLLWVYYPLANVAFLIYDIALDKMIKLWMIKLRRTFGFDKRR